MLFPKALFDFVPPYQDKYPTCSNDISLVETDTEHNKKSLTVASNKCSNERYIHTYKIKMAKQFC